MQQRTMRTKSKAQQKRVFGLKRAHVFSSYNRIFIETQKCAVGCFYCKRVFKASEVERWIENDETALCPHCGIDSVLPGIFPWLPCTSESFLEEMHQFWFRNSNGELKPTFEESIERASKAIASMGSRKWPKKVMVKEGPRTYWVEEDKLSAHKNDTIKNKSWHKSLWDWICS